MSVKEQEQIKIYEYVRTPKMYCCVIHNDDVTTMDFVVLAISKVFNKSSYEATQIMADIHNSGSAKIGLFCYDIAVTKKNAMDSMARTHSFPLLTTVMEAEE